MTDFQKLTFCSRGNLLKKMLSSLGKSGLKLGLAVNYGDGCMVRSPFLSGPSCGTFYFQESGGTSEKSSG